MNNYCNKNKSGAKLTRSPYAIVKRHIFFHQGTPFSSLDEITEVDEEFIPSRNHHILVNSGSTDEKTWIRNVIFFNADQIQLSKNNTAAITTITSTGSSSSESSDFQLAQTLEMSGAENEYLNSTIASRKHKEHPPDEPPFGKLQIALLVTFDHPR